MGASTCIVIGDAAATLRCAQIAQERGVRVVGVVTGDARIGAWAAQTDLPCCFAPPRLRLAAAPDATDDRTRRRA